MRYLSGLLASISIILAGCGGGEAGQGEEAVGSSAGSSIAPVALTIGVTVSGLGAGLQVTLLNSLGNATIASNNGAFTFSNPISDKESYSVTVGTQPIGQICMVSDGSGTGTAVAAPATAATAPALGALALETTVTTVAHGNLCQCLSSLTMTGHWELNWHWGPP